MRRHWQYLKYVLRHKWFVILAGIELRVTCWRQLAEIANQYVRKGGQVMVAGRVGVSAYTNKAGQPAASLELTADKLVLLGSRADTGAPEPSPDDVGNIPF